MERQLQFKSIGSDPEVFLRNANGELVPSFEFINATKDSAINFDEHISVLCDNVMLEYTTEPATTADEFIENNKISIKTIRSILPPDIVFATDVYTEDFSEEVLSHDIAQTFGCSPDYNAHTNSMNVPPEPSSKGRSAGGHVHICWDSPKKGEARLVMRVMDLFLGLPLLALDKDTRRKKMYGKAGCYRPKPYGAEYRVLSSFWIHDEQVMRFMFDNVQKAFEFINEGKSNLSEAEWSVIRQCIDNNDIPTSELLMKKYNVNQWKYQHIAMETA